MKKRRFQPTFASLTEAELEQLASDVQRETYDTVRERICKPRSEGGLDLHFSSNSPLVRLHNKKNRLDLINAHITSGHKLTLAQFDPVTAGEHRAPEEVHDAIMSATYLLVTEQDNTPHQLLALQRLADFPERAALRAQSAENLSRLREQMATIRAERLELARSKEARAQAKAQREAEMHTHKIQMDHIRVFLKSNSGGTSFGGGTSSGSPILDSRDAIDYKNATPADLYVQSEKSFSSDPKSETKNHKSEIRSFLSPEVIANTNLYDQKIDTGEIRVIYTPGKHYEIEYCNPADQPALERLHTSGTLRFFQDPTRTQWLPGLRTFGKNPYIPPSASSSSSSSFHGTNSTPQTIPSKTEL